MAGTNLSFPYDENVFNYRWRTAPDPILTTLLQSGVIVYDAELAQLVSNGSNLYTYPYANILDDTEPGVYNGVNDITFEELSGDYMVGVVYGRQKGWKAKQFIKDFNSGADPMGQILNGTVPYWQKWRQRMLINILEALTGITGNAEFAKHVTDLSTSTATVTDENLIDVNTLSDAQVKACGDMADDFAVAFMHSTVAHRLRNLKVLEYLKYTDANGIERPTTIGTIGGLTVITNDNVPVADSTSAVGSKEYTTFVLGTGLLGYAPAPVTRPSEAYRDPIKNGGTDMIINRLRESILPYGFTFKGSASGDVGITDAVLHASASWELKFPAKAIKLIKVVTNG